MNDFITRFQDQLSGTLSGFDRLSFRGTLWKDRLSGMKGYLWAHGLGGRDLGKHAEEMSERVREASLAPLVAAHRPVLYLNSAKDDKQQLALQIAHQDEITEGPICAFKAVELCQSYTVRRNARTQRPELALAPRKGLHIYHYWMHPTFGFMSVRLQTWFPFSLNVFVNGREWLARQMDRAGIEYRRHDNCFTWIADVARAQTLMDQQRRADWIGALDAMARQVHPLLFAEMSIHYLMKYSWTCQDSEWAMDLMFRNPEQLRRLVPRLLHLGVVSFSSPDVLRFMGKRVSRQGTAYGRHELPICSDLKVRSNGARIKHRLGPNSIKLYDKAYDELAAVLRLEATISEPQYFHVYRCTTADSPVTWRRMRKDVADLPHRALESQKAVDRYACALASVDDQTTLEELTAQLERRVRWKGQSVRALHPFCAEDHALLTAIHHGEFNISGFRNRDLQAILYLQPARNDAERRRRSAAVSRKIRMLRAHGLIRKRSRSYRYDVTAHGRLVLNAILTAHRVTLRQITEVAA